MGWIGFESHVREELEREFDKAWDKGYREGKRTAPADSPLARERREVFLALLWSAAEGAPGFIRLEERKQQNRRRALEQVATGAIRLAESIDKLDGDAAAFLLYQITQEAEGKEEADALSPFRYFILANQKRPEVVELLGATQRAALRAAKELPLQKTNAALAIALVLERRFWEWGFEFTASHSSFAAICLGAVFEAGELERTSLQYWIEQARDHPDSMTSFVERERASQNR